MKKDISKKKQKKIDEFKNKPVNVGEHVYVKKSSLISWETKSEKTLCKVISIKGSKIKVKVESSTYTIKKSDILSKLLIYVGENPFDEIFETTRPVAFALSSILHYLGINDDREEKYKINGVIVGRCNWNPFIYKKGKKYYYQRDFIWKVKDKRLLIESIYQNVDCGKILVRKRGWQELENMKGEKELYFNDIVDGKQRLDAVRGFINNEFKDNYGNYYNDLSDHAQTKLVEHQLFGYSEMPENSKDNDVIRQFLKLNFTGVPQSKEHINFVKTLR